MRKWGGDPDLGRALVEGLSRSTRLIVADYEGHRMAQPAAETLTPENLAADFLAIADAGGAGAFGYYGYSWLALAGLQLALRTDRLRALAMGGFPLGIPGRGMVSAAAGESGGRRRRPCPRVRFQQHAGSVKMSEAAALVGMPEPTFSKYFKRATGQNFSDLVRKLRLAHARRLLERTDKAISDICYEVGFSNLSNFNRHFLNDAGETPRNYRQRVQG